MNICFDPALIDAIARTLAKCDGRFVSYSEWVGEVGELYREKAVAVISTLIRWESGICSGGLVPAP